MSLGDLYILRTSYLDKNNDFTREFMGFSVYISNTTNKEDGVLCFRDTTTPEPRYLILSTSPVLTTGDTSSTTTTGLILRILRGILYTTTMSSVKWKFTVRNLICPDRTLRPEYAYTACFKQKLL